MSGEVDWKELLAHPEVNALLDLAVREDIGPGDATSNAIFTEPLSAHGEVIARSNTVACGLPLFAEIFGRIAEGAQIELHAYEGKAVTAGQSLATLRGDVRLLLAGERCVLNFAMRLCGIAAATRRAVEMLPEGCRTRI